MRSVKFMRLLIIIMSRTSDMKLYQVGELCKNERLTVNGIMLHRDCRWFKLLEGEKKGLEFLFPLNYPDYDEEIKNAMNGLSEDEYVRLSLKSVNEKDTVWICTGIETDISPKDYIWGPLKLQLIFLTCFPLMASFYYTSDIKADKELSTDF